jgi:hypothetical protein
MSSCRTPCIGKVRAVQQLSLKNIYGLLMTQENELICLFKRRRHPRLNMFSVI